MKLYISLLTLLFVSDVSGCDTLLNRLLTKTDISIPSKLSINQTPYSFWCEKIEESYQSYSEDKDKDCFNFIFSACKRPQLELLKAKNAVTPSMFDYYHQSIQSWKKIEIPNDDQFTLFIHHMYFLDNYYPISSEATTEKKQFNQLLNIYPTILRIWHNTLNELFEEKHANLNSYLIQGNEYLKKYCADLVTKVKNPLVNIITTNNNLDTLIADVLSRRHITSFQKELFFWYGFELLSISSEKQEILDCVKKNYEKIKPKEGETWQQEVFEYFLQVASILETNILFKDKPFSYSDSIPDSISAYTLNYFEKSKDNFFLKKFIPESDKFDAIASFYKRKVSLKRNIEALKYLLSVASEKNLKIIKETNGKTYQLTQMGTKICDYIISVGCCSNQSYCGKDDLQAINDMKSNDLISLITQNRHIIATTRWDNLLCVENFYDIQMRTTLKYNEYQKNYIQFEDKILDSGETVKIVHQEAKNDSGPRLEKRNASSFLTKKLLLGGIGIAMASGLLGFLYYLQKNPEAYLSVYVQIYSTMRNLY